MSSVKVRVDRVDQEDNERDNKGDDKGEAEEEGIDVRRSKKGFSSLFFSYGLSSWGDRTWEFAALVSIVQLYPTTLFYASLFGLCETLTGLASGPLVGRWVDTHSREGVIRTSISVQNSLIAVACFALYIGIASEKDDQWARLLCWTLSTGLACVIRIAFTLNKIALKEWCPVLADNDTSILSELNASLRRIDLTNSIVGPLLYGALSAWLNSLFALTCLGVWSVLSLYLELHFIGNVWKQFPQLHNKEIKPIESCCDDAKSVGFIEAFLLLAHSPVFWPSLSYCILYMSVLNFGGIFTSYLTSDALKLNEVVIAVGRGSGALVGVLSTLTSSRLISWLGLVRCGSVGISAQFACLVGALYAFYSVASLTRTSFVVILFLFLSCSRFGLWLFDLCETQLLQVGVPSQQLGIINGAQESLLNLFTVGSFVLTLVFSDPMQFYLPATISFIAVGTSALIYLLWSCSSQVSSIANR